MDPLSGVTPGLSSPLFSARSQQVHFGRTVKPAFDQVDLRFGRADAPPSFLPNAESVFPSDALRQGILEYPFEQGFQAADKKASLLGNPYIDTRTLVMETCRVLIEPSRMIEKLQELRATLEPKYKFALEGLEGLLPPDARYKSLKAEPLYRILYTHIADKLEKKLHADPPRYARNHQDESDPLSQLPDELKKSSKGGEECL